MYPVRERVKANKTDENKIKRKQATNENLFLYKKYNSIIKLKIKIRKN